ncbi:type IX secretion system ring protein PorN/GldN [Tenacibaculum aquimarinum]|uniref:type IX secretion system ring protein PorN/GldN n=1 Tax=Tenacibaculum aquimarinum TaxID=2910675 RepID=UPI001F0A0646|nr:gliding motility protein GldN [Tenacibaculum aquimarinum]MCH3884361.1 gliding motility protein GldN [Tenacibaculum aquimarinum]
MNWKRFYMILVLVATVSVANAQSNLLNAKKAGEIGVKSEEQKAVDKDKPLPYGYIADRDVLWSKVVWEYVDLSQKINLPYYFPIDTLNAPANRRSLFDTLLKGVKSGQLTEVYTDSYFTTKVNVDELDQLLVNSRQVGDYVDNYEIKSDRIEGYMLKGMWYFDKRQGELKYRLLAIAPMGPDVQSLGVEEIDDSENVYELFWVFYPEARDLLHKTKVFNPKNSSQPISYDNLLNARRFNSTIVKEENIYGNRGIKDYVRGNSLFQLLEAEKIKDGIRNREMDMWNY